MIKGGNPFYHKYIMNISFDIINDLNLTHSDKFVWEGKTTSLYCLISGNISEDPKIVHRTLTYLSLMYQGIFYIDGSLEQTDLLNRTDKIDELEKICKSINNAVYLYDNVIIMHGIAIIGINGWYKNCSAIDERDQDLIEVYRREDIVYLRNIIKKLQLHGDVKEIIVLSNSVPNKSLYFGETTETVDELCPTMCLSVDTEKKVKYWLFGTYDKKVDTEIHGINFVSNPYIKNEPYWAKRIEIKI